MNARAIKKFVDDAERTYHRCWDILASLRRNSPGPELPGFQHQLGRAMQSLEEAYQALARHRQRLIDRKDKISLGWFAREQRRLDRHQKILHRAIGVGYSLGDAFAWYFYQFDRPLLDQHAAHERQTHPAYRVGGQAELAALGAFLDTGRYIPIYHGMTTILRLGDITLIDMEQWRVAAIGEVKTSKPDSAGWAEATVTFVGHRDDFALEDFNRRIRNANRRRPAAASRPSTSQRDSGPSVSKPVGRFGTQGSRLERQLRRIQDGLKAARETASAPGSGVNATPTPLRLLDEVARGCRRGRATSCRLDTGLVALVYRSRFRSLYHRLAQTEELDPTGFPPDAMGVVQETIVKGSVWNHAVVSAVHYDSEGLPVLPSGTLPVPWWQIDPDLARDILFYTVTVLTVWNPASLLQRLEAAGFEVDPGGLPHRLRLIRRSLDGRPLSYVDDGFSRLIPRVLAREEDVAEMILRFWDHAEHETTGGMRVQLRTVHEYFSEDAFNAMRRRPSSAT